MASLPFVSESFFPAVEESSTRSAALRGYLAETPELAGVTQATRLEVRPAPALATFGIVTLDQLTGGLPRGCLTEISGPDSSGRTSVLLAALAAATRRGEICALIDASDAFHPDSGTAAGIDFSRLLWVRCTPAPAVREKNSASGSNALMRDARVGDKKISLEEQQRRQRENPVEQALRAADLLLQGGGFGLIVMDLAGVPAKIARRIPLTTWFRFRRAVETTSTILLAVGEQSCAQTCATLSLRLSGQERTQAKKRPAFSMPSYGVGSPWADPNIAMWGFHLEDRDSPSHSQLLEGLSLRVEVLRSRLERKPVQSAIALQSQSADLRRACSINSSSARKAAISDTKIDCMNAFDLHAEPLRAHG